MQGIGAEVPLHDEPGVGVEVQAGEPLLKHPVQFVFSDPDRWVRPDGGEPDVGGNILGPHDVDVVEGESLGVAACGMQRTLIDVNCPHGGVGR